MKRDTITLALTTLAFITLAAVTLATTIVLAQPASAHHPEIKASAECVQEAPLVSWTASSWSTGAKGTNQKVEVYRNGTLIATGKFTAGNGYDFAGSFDGTPYEGQTLTISTKAINRWGNGNRGGQVRSTTVTVPGDCVPPPTTVPPTTVPPTTVPPTTVPPTTVPPTTVPPTTEPPATTVPPTTEPTPTTTAPPVEICTGEDEAEVCTSSITLEISAPEAEPVIAEPSFTG